MTNKLEPEWLTNARYWADLDTESGDYRDRDTGYRVARLACMDWRGEYLRRALEFIEKLRDESTLADEVVLLYAKVERLSERCSDLETEDVMHRHDMSVAEEIRDAARAESNRHLEDNRALRARIAELEFSMIVITQQRDSANRAMTNLSRLSRQIGLICGLEIAKERAFIDEEEDVCMGDVPGTWIDWSVAEAALQEEIRK